MPPCHVIPELGYSHVREATDWLFRAFGFTLRLQIADDVNPEDWGGTVGQL
jgi:hypothetical protein